MRVQKVQSCGVKSFFTIFLIDGLILVLLFEVSAALLSMLYLHMQEQRLLVAVAAMARGAEQPFFVDLPRLLPTVSQEWFQLLLPLREQPLIYDMQYLYLEQSFLQSIQVVLQIAHVALGDLVMEKLLPKLVVIVDGWIVGFADGLVGSKVLANIRFGVSLDFLDFLQNLSLYLGDGIVQLRLELIRSPSLLQQLPAHLFFCNWIIESRQNSIIQSGSHEEEGKREAAKAKSKGRASSVRAQVRDLAYPFTEVLFSLGFFR